MNNPLFNSWHWLIADLRRLGVLISLLLSGWIILTSDTMAGDGVFYLDAAYQIAQGNWAEAYAIYKWLFFSTLIALLSKLPFFDVYSSGLIINTLLFASLPWLFLSILKTMGANRSTLLAGLLLISIVPYLNEYRADILRGVGSWASFLLALLMLIRFQQTSRWRYALWWGAASIVSVLFRIELITYLILMPLGLFFYKDRPLIPRIKLILSCYSLPLFIVTTLVPLILLGIVSAGRLLEPFSHLQNFWGSLTTRIPLKAQIINENILNPLSGDFGTAGVFSILFTLLFVTIIKRTTILISLLIIYTLVKRHLRQSIQHLPLLLWMMAINLLYLTVYVTHSFFLTGRIAMPLALSAALIACYPLASVMQKPFSQLNTLKEKFLRGAIIFLLLFMALDGLVSFGQSKAYFPDAGAWLKNTMKPGETLITNELLINHYAGIHMTHEDRLKIYDFSYKLHNNSLKSKDLESGNYVALKTKHIEPETLEYIHKTLGRHPTKEFKKTDKDKIIIFRIN